VDRLGSILFPPVTKSDLPTDAPGRGPLSPPLPFPPAAQAASLVGTTLEAHITAGTRGTPGATGELGSLLNAIALAVRIIHTKVRAAGLAGMLGYTGDTNVQGEAVQKLDAVAQEILCAVLEKSGRCAMIVSEELDGAHILGESGKYIVLFDPLDGSSNIDVNISIGTIFCVLRMLRAAEGGAPRLEGALVPGTHLVAAGYSVYGSATTLVLSTGHGVHGFTLDPGVGEFFLSHPGLRCPPRGHIYSINEGNAARWDERTKKWAAWIKSEDATEGRPYAQRYVGSLVADAHRTLLKGGIFAYPSDRKNPAGKLRLLYEANPMAYLFEQAGGMATDGVARILERVPEGLHDRTPLVLGSKDDVETYGQFMRGER
jgi:fructose-1,6-bisphosphatase I